MLEFKHGDRVEVKVRPDTRYTWQAAWGQRGTVTNREKAPNGVYVTFDDFAEAGGGWFHADELTALNDLDRLVEEIDV